MKSLFLNLVLFAFAFCANAQQYKPFYQTAIGARAGSTVSTCGITVKTFVAEKSALEAIVGYYKNGISATALFEQHHRLFRRNEFQFYYGGGTHFNSSSEYQNWILIQGRVLSYEKAANSYGFDAICGIEYKFLSIPLAVSIDLKPAIEFNRFKSYTLGVDQGLGLKLTF